MEGLEPLGTMVGLPQLIFWFNFNRLKNERDMKIKLDNIESGWIHLNIFDNGEVIIEDSISYTPYDSLGELVDALYLLNGNANIEKRVVFNSEPFEYELTFRKSAEDIELNINGYQDHKRVENSQKHLYSTTGTYDDICKPFWRALRVLQSGYTKEQLDELWHRGFPYDDLNELSRILKIKL